MKITVLCFLSLLLSTGAIGSETCDVSASESVAAGAALHSAQEMSGTPVIKFPLTVLSAVNPRPAGDIFLVKVDLRDGEPLLIYRVEIASATCEVNSLVLVPQSDNNGSREITTDALSSGEVCGEDAANKVKCENPYFQSCGYKYPWTTIEDYCCSCRYIF